MRKSSSSSVIIILLMAVIGMLLYNNCSHKVQPSTNTNQPTQREKPSTNDRGKSSQPIEELTKEATVVPYVKQHGKLPDYYITKKLAREQGWNPAQGNMCDVLPGRAIGGDVFTNREGSLPQKSGRKWYEADLNFTCGHRNADRLLFSSDGLVFVTRDHYKTFQEK